MEHAHAHTEREKTRSVTVNFFAAFARLRGRMTNRAFLGESEANGDKLWRAGTALRQI